ncbi:MAG: hypothetical protein WBA46_17665 [Thermomicrobiales bacterium]
MSKTVYDPDTDLGPETTLLDPHMMFIEDIIEDERDFPQMHDPERIAVWEFYPKDHVDERTPDIVTKRTKAYIVAWELRKDHPAPPFR